MFRVALFLIGVILLISAALLFRPQDGTCPEIGSQLEVGMIAYVLLIESNNIYAEPSRASQALVDVKLATQGKILEGPVCRDGIRWWRINSEGRIGWTAENDDSGFYMYPNDVNRDSSDESGEEETVSGENIPDAAASFVPFELIQTIPLKWARKVVWHPQGRIAIPTENGLQEPPSKYPLLPDEDVVGARYDSGGVMVAMLLNNQSGDGRSLSVWVTAGSAFEEIMRVPVGQAKDLAFNASGGLVATSYGDETTTSVKIWATASQKQTREIITYTYAEGGSPPGSVMISDFDFTSKGLVTSTGNPETREGETAIWDVRTGEKTVMFPTMALNLVVDPEAKFIIVPGLKSLEWWNIATGAVTELPMAEPGAFGLMHVTLSRDGKTVAAWNTWSLMVSVDTRAIYVFYFRSLALSH